MSTILTRGDLRREIERFRQGELGAQVLAAWAFDQFYAAEEERIAYEAGYEATIGAVLDELMWSDSPPFELDHAQAQSLLDRLEMPAEHTQ